MRRFLFAAVAAVSTVALGQVASAADLPRKAPPPLIAPAPVMNWTGWYVGVNAGWIGASGNVNTNATNVSFPTDPTTTTTLAASATSQFDNRDNGFLGGGQIGYNYQFSSAFVAGLEADIQGSSLSGSTNFSNSVLTNTVAGPNTGLWITSGAVSQRLNYLGTVRGRLGWTATPNLLIYGTGGFAYGGVESNTSLAIGSNVGGVPAGFTSGSFSDTRTGWAAGAGFEWMFVPNWTAKLEYLHYDLGSATYATGGYSVNVGPTSLPGGGFATIATSTTAHFNGDIVRVGLNYIFH